MTAPARPRARASCTAGVCVGGFDAGKTCTSTSQCGGTCAGGPNNGKRCTSNGSCPDTPVCLANPLWSDDLWKGEAFAATDDGAYAVGRNFDYGAGWNDGYRVNPDGSFDRIPSPPEFPYIVNPYVISENAQAVAGTVGDFFSGTAAVHLEQGPRYDRLPALPHRAGARRAVLLVPDLDQRDQRERQDRRRPGPEPRREARGLDRRHQPGPRLPQPRERPPARGKAATRTPTARTDTARTAARCASTTSSSAIRASWGSCEFKRSGGTRARAGTAPRTDREVPVGCLQRRVPVQAQSRPGPG